MEKFTVVLLAKCVALASLFLGGCGGGNDDIAWGGSASMDGGGVRYSSTPPLARPDGGARAVCVEGTERSCTRYTAEYMGVRSCVSGVQQCVGGAWTQCAADEDDEDDEDVLYGDTVEEDLEDGGA